MTAGAYPQQNRAPGPGGEPQRFPGGRLPDLGQAFNEVLQSVMRDLGPYALAGLGYMLVIMPIALLLMMVIWGAVVIGVVGLAAGAESGTASASDPLMSFGIVGGMIALFVVGALMMNVGIAPFFASTMRAVARHQRGEQQLGFGAAFSSARQDPGRVIGSMVLVTFISLGALLFCYFPVFIAAFLLALALPFAALHRLPAVASIKASVAQARAAKGWHLKFFLVLMLTNAVAGYVPVVGPMFVVAFLVRVYRELAGDGEQPVLARGA